MVEELTGRVGEGEWAMREESYIKRKERIRTYPLQRQKPCLYVYVGFINLRAEEMDSRKDGNNRKISASPVGY